MAAVSNRPTLHPDLLNVALSCNYVSESYDKSNYFGETFAYLLFFSFWTFSGAIFRVIGSWHFYIFRTESQIKLQSETKAELRHGQKTNFLHSNVLSTLLLSRPLQINCIKRRWSLAGTKLISITKAEWKTDWTRLLKPFPPVLWNWFVSSRSIFASHLCFQHNSKSQDASRVFVSRKDLGPSLTGVSDESASAVVEFVSHVLYCI